MKKLKFAWVTGLFFLLFLEKTTGQVYGVFNSGIREIDLCNCLIGDPVSFDMAESLSMGNNQDLYYPLNGQLLKLDLPSGALSVVATLPAGFFSVSTVFGPDGLIYLSGTGITDPFTETLITVNPNTGAITILGDLPTGLFMQGDLFFNNGLLYGLVIDNDGLSLLIQIPIANPPAMTVVQSFPNLGDMVGGISVFINGEETVFVLADEFPNGSNGMVEMDINSGDYEYACAGVISGAGDLAAPPNYEVPPCCADDAGNFASLDLIFACSGQSVTFDHLGDEVLNSGSALSYILYGFSGISFPQDIIQISATPTFTFDPATMNLNTVYYVAAVAAPGPPGNPNWSSNCIDLSLPAQVAWRESPTVALAGANPLICGSGCLEFPLEFSGLFPIDITWEIDFGNETINGNFTADDPTETLTVCPPAGGNFQTGSFQLNFLTIADANCSCD